MEVLHIPLVRAILLSKQFLTEEQFGRRTQLRKISRNLSMKAIVGIRLWKPGQEERACRRPVHRTHEKWQKQQQEHWRPPAQLPAPSSCRSRRPLPTRKPG